MARKIKLGIGAFSLWAFAVSATTLNSTRGFPDRLPRKASRIIPSDIKAMRKNTLLQIGTGSQKPLRASTLALCSALTLLFTSPVIAQEPASDATNGGDVSRQQIQTVIDPVDVKSSDKAWRNNTSVIAQIGNDNRANIAQSRNTMAFAAGNYAKVYQYGDNNEANIIQSGGNNIGLIGQIGSGHKATIEQAGNRFEAQVNQFGRKSNIDISQSGSGLRSISVGQRSASGMAPPVTIRTN